MKIRNTERNHSFNNKLEEEIPFYSLQGLTIDGKNQFSAGLEAVEFSQDEDIDLNSVFSNEAWTGKYTLCQQLGVPLYFLVYKHNETSIRIYEVEVSDGKALFYLQSNKSFNDFCAWFASIKGTIQTKPLYEADPRKSFFDNLIEKKGLSWGGNIDSFCIEGNRVTSIIETRTATRFAITNYNPARFFLGTRERAGDYKTWEPLFMLASQLETPLFLITFTRATTQESAGFATLDTMSKQRITYQDAVPNGNILRGVDSVRKELERKMKLRSPRIL